MTKMKDDPGLERSMGDIAFLRLLADWFDKWKEHEDIYETSIGIADRLRKIADRIGAKHTFATYSEEDILDNITDIPRHIHR